MLGHTKVVLVSGFSLLPVLAYVFECRVELIMCEIRAAGFLKCHDVMSFFKKVLASLLTEEFLNGFQWMFNGTHG